MSLYEELDGMTDEDEAYDDLVSLARFCLLTRIPYVEARQMPDVLQQAFIEAYNEIHKER